MQAKQMMLGLFGSAILGGGVAVGGYKLLEPAPVAPQSVAADPQVRYTSEMRSSTYAVPEGLNFVAAALGHLRVAGRHLPLKLLHLVAEELAQEGVHLLAAVAGRRSVFGHYVHHGRRHGGCRSYEVQPFGYGVGAAPHLGGVTHLGVGSYRLGRHGGRLQQLVPPHGHAAAKNGGTEQAEHHLFCLHG